MDVPYGNIRKLLLYNFNIKEKLSEIKASAFKSEITLVYVDKESYSLTVGYEAGIDGFKREASDEGSDFDEEMLIMCGLSGGEMNALLDALRRENVNIPLKAVLTETNAKWSSARLYKELSAERDMFKAMSMKKAVGKGLHNI